MARAAVNEPDLPFKTPDLRIDIAVVGAGVSGAYAAWRLKREFPDKAIVLFEYSDRIGGRLFSKTLPGMPHVNAELGGMRFEDSTIPGSRNTSRP